MILALNLFRFWVVLPVGLCLAPAIALLVALGGPLAKETFEEIVRKSAENYQKRNAKKEDKI
jgi:hypothetical protein